MNLLRAALLLTPSIPSLRIDRAVTVHMVKSGRQSCRSAVPVLMYHSIADTDESGTFAYYRTATSPAVFAHHMAFLKEHRYATLGLAQVAQRLGSDDDCSGCVAITFDDGYEDCYRNAFPILQRFGFTATVFLPTSFIGEAPGTAGCSPARRFLHGKTCLTWSEVREMHRSGICFGSHTVSHARLRDLEMHRVADELTLSKTLIEQELGDAIDSFAYPYAFPEEDAAFVEFLRGCLTQAGYRYGVCSSVGRVVRAADRLFMRRLPMNSCDDLALFTAKLSGAYDWVARVQYASKAARAALHLRRPSIEVPS
jgi:peptidoglycan/xylan/chitin deacetylase (PgdA/CDA1 family)